MAYHYTLAFSAIVSVLTYYAYIKFLRYRQVFVYSRRYGCLQPPASPDSGLIGLRLILTFRASYKAKKLLEGQVQRYVEYGTTHTTSLLGSTLVMTIEPENIKAILANKFDDFGLGTRLKTFSPLLTGGIFVNDGEPWKHSRALVRPAFTRNQVADLESFEFHTQKLIAKLPKDGSTVDLGPLFFRLTLDQASEFLLGESVNSQNGEEDSPAARFGTAFDSAVSSLGGIGTSGITSYLWPNRRFFRDCRTAHLFVENFVQEARERRAIHLSGNQNLPTNEKPESGRYVFVDELAKVTDDPRQMRDELLSILLAGRDTTASMLTSAFNILGKRPDIWAKLRDEAELLGGEPPDYERLRNMKYLRYFLNESKFIFHLNITLAKELQKCYVYTQPYQETPERRPKTHFSPSAVAPTENLPCS